MTTFSTRQVARLHQQQFGPWCDPTGKPDGYPPPGHPYTCPNRGNHPVIAGDKGILVPTIRGWICQCCDYTQPQPDEALAAGPPAPDRDARQATVAEWVVRCWGDRVLADTAERGARLLEEAVETAQALDLPFEAAAHILAYVYGRPAGDPAQEVGGVGVTLLALAAALGLSADACERDEVARVLAKPVEHFRRRHAEKEQAGVMVTQQATHDEAVEIPKFLHRADRSEDGTVFSEVTPTPATVAEIAANAATPPAPDESAR